MRKKNKEKDLKTKFIARGSAKILPGPNTSTFFLRRNTEIVESSSSSSSG